MGDRPAVYVHFELGVSWPKHLSKDRHITYISKSMRDRANQFPRQLPPVNTNYLAAPTQYQVAYQQQPVPQIQEPQAHPPYQLTYYTNEIPPNTYNRDPVTAAPAQTVQYQPYQPVQQPQHYIHEYYAPVAPVQPPVEEEEVRGSSRSMSRGSHERGRSAPPPFNDSPWDVGSSSNSQGVPQLWKALPATPNQYRLGEDNMPWSTWSFPMGYNENEDEGDDVERGESRSREASIRATWGPEFPGEPARRPESDDRHRGKAKDIQSLATALMTVDNGFEDQWWYQGPRLVNLHGTVLVPTAVPKSSFHPDFQQGSVGWAVSREEEMRQKDAQEKYQRQLQKEQLRKQKQHLQQLQQHQQRQHQQQQQQQQRQQLESFVPSTPSFQVVSPPSSVADIVSPLSEYPSPLSSFGGLRRSLTTRSDELHM